MISTYGAGIGRDYYGLWSLKPFLDYHRVLATFVDGALNRRLLIGGGLSIVAMGGFLTILFEHAIVDILYAVIDPKIRYVMRTGARYVYR